jgi:hypothetical protein
MIYVNGVRLWLQVSRQRSIKICSYPCHFALSSSRAKAINEMPIRSQEVVAKQAPKGRERIHGDLSGEAIEEQGCSRGSLHPARLAIVGGKRETVHWPSTTPSRAASTLGPWPSGVFYYLLFVCVQRWREQLDRKAAAAALPVKGRGREGKGEGDVRFKPWYPRPKVRTVRMYEVLHVLASDLLRERSSVRRSSISGDER